MIKQKKTKNFVHIGKCAGTTIWHIISSRVPSIAGKMNYFHLSKPPHRPYVDNVITLRNPIKRFVSAFYWRYYLVCEANQQPDKYLNEYERLKEYETIENFVTDIADKGKIIYNSEAQSGQYIHQCKQDIYWYLEDIYNRNNPTKVDFCITQENLNDDMKKFFQLNKVPMRVHDSSKRLYDKFLSEKSIDTLKNVLEMDFKCIDRLYEWGKITDKQYELLNLDYPIVEKLKN